MQTTPSLMRSLRDCAAESRGAQDGQALRQYLTCKMAFEALMIAWTSDEGECSSNALAARSSSNHATTALSTICVPTLG